MSEAQPSVLIVDDDADDLASVERALRMLACELVSLKDPHGVLPSVQRLQPAVVILDALLPGLSGFDLCKQIKTDPQLKGTQVLILTGVYLRQQYRQEALQQFKADAFLTKPFRPPELQRLVVQLLSKRTRSPQAGFLKRTAGAGEARKTKKRGFFDRIFGKADAEPESTRIAPREGPPSVVAESEPRLSAPPEAPPTAENPVEPVAEGPPAPEAETAAEPIPETAETAVQTEPEPEPEAVAAVVETAPEPERTEPQPTPEAATESAPESKASPVEAAPEPAPTEVEPESAAPPVEVAPEPEVAEAAPEPEAPALPENPDAEVVPETQEREAEKAAPEPVAEPEPPPPVEEVVSEPANSEPEPVSEPVAPAVKAPIAPDVPDTPAAPEPSVEPESSPEPAPPPVGESALDELEARPSARPERVQWMEAQSKTRELRPDEIPPAAAATATVRSEPAAVAPTPEPAPAPPPADAIEEVTTEPEAAPPASTKRPRPKAGDVPVYEEEEEFVAELRRELSKCKRVDRPLTLILIRVSDLSQIVELFGRDVREPVLWHVAEQAMAALREVDFVGMVSSKDLVAMTAFASDRYGGSRIVSRMRHGIKKNPFPVGEELPPIIPVLRFGMATFPQDGNDAPSLMSAAEKELAID